MNFTRRQMLKTATILASTAPFENWVEADAYQYFLAKISGGEAILPTENYIPFNWAFSEISAKNDGIKLSTNQVIPQKNESARLRVTSATDVREELIFEVKTAVSGKKIADWDLRFAALMQPFELLIPKEDLQAVFKEGIILKMIKGTKPFWFFSENN